MLQLNIDDKMLEQIYFKEFHSDKKRFIEFIKKSYEKIKMQNEHQDRDLKNLQIDSMQHTWDNNQDKAWDEL
ncbi:MAG: hypothetical protein ACOCP1_01360 [Campylobacterales bacterium]